MEANCKKMDGKLLLIAEVGVEAARTAGEKLYALITALRQ
jgi:hypothetical protein